MGNTGSGGICLENGRLSVEVALPGTYYKGSRFDWNGFVTQVTLDGTHTFCVPESLTTGHGTGGCGLCGEFGIHEPVGYDDAAVGGCFPKIGVGTVTKPDVSRYDFSRSYEFTPFKTEIDKSGSSIEFYSDQAYCNGYSLIYEKRISLEGSCLKMEYLLKNTGIKTVHTTEYCHNFIGIDGENVGRGYTLSLPYIPVIASLPSAMERAADNGLTWKDEGWENAFYCIIGGYKLERSHSWDIYSSRKGAGVREYDDFIPAKFALWGMRHVISPEVFMDINVKPGEILAWTRRYEFYSKV